MTLVYESGAMIESAVAASEFKEHFNCSNDNVKLDSRSKKKGPEPESVEVAEIDGKRYAFVGLERTGGVMMFDITDFLKGKAALSAYANSRDYSLPMAGDVAPEGLDFLPAEKSPTGKALLFVANENSGTVAVYALEEETKTYRMYETFIPAPDDGDHGKTGSSTLVIYSENGTDLAEKSLSGSITAGEVYIIRCAAANTTSAVINVADTDDNSADFEAVSFKGEAQGSEKATTYMKKLGLE